ncbi:MAG: hypothetical protein WBW51_06050 [Methyloceanibacter sp.]
MAWFSLPEFEFSLGISSSKDGERTPAIRLGFDGMARKSVAGESVARQFGLSTVCVKQPRDKKPLMRLQLRAGSSLHAFVARR